MMRQANIVELVGREGHAIALKAETVDAVVGEDDGCTVVTRGDTHRVTASYAEVVAELWPRP